MAIDPAAALSAPPHNSSASFEQYIRCAQTALADKSIHQGGRYGTASQSSANLSFFHHGLLARAPEI
jgi:hypothetical protein